MELGLHTTLDDTNSILDPEVVALTDTINPLMSKEFGKVFDLYSQRPKPFETDKYEILNREYTAPEISVTASGAGVDWDDAADTTGLPVSAGTISRITIGDVILVQAEVVVVKSVDRTGNTIDVYERGAGDSTGAAHGVAAITAKIVGNASREGVVEAEAMAEDTAQRYEYCQLVMEVIDLSKCDSDQARKTGRTEDVLKSEAVERVMRDLARNGIYGQSRANTATIPGMARGLISSLEDVTGALKTAVSGAYTETSLKNIIDDVRAAGGSVNGIVMSVAKKRIFNTFTGADQIQVDRGVSVGGHVLDGYIADGNGVIPAIVDIDFPDDKVAIINSRYMYKGWKNNDQLRFAPEPSGSREKKESLQGKFSHYVEGVGKTHGLLTALT